MAVIVQTSDTGGRTMFIKMPTSNTTNRAIPKPLPSSSDEGIKVMGVVGEETTALPIVGFDLILLSDSLKIMCQ